jgi:hypothetical protein
MTAFKSIKSLQQAGYDLPSPKKRRPTARPTVQNIFSPEMEEHTDWQDVTRDGQLADTKITLPVRAAVATIQQLERLDALDSLIDAMVWRAGTCNLPDSSQILPLLVFCSCAIPKTKSIDLSALLQRLRVRLETYVQEPYAAVIFASPSAQLSTAQLLSFYVNLSRQAKKNVQRLFIVHASFFTRILIRFFLNGIVSGKVGKRRKVVTEDCLSSLAKAVDVTQIDIPREVYEWVAVDVSS